MNADGWVRERNRESIQFIFSPPFYDKNGEGSSIAHHVTGLGEKHWFTNHWCSNKSIIPEKLNC